ncbi:hypothetical protein VPH35_000954 [Triticum aestivum]|uniref:uncharacterized protein n=1 Tax=Triticum aestivum TaxID=4565 RepID=UPI001D021E46|nr:uncharacterized protein LOC123189713 [Triticum aestivum]
MRVHVRGGAGEAGGSLSPLYLSSPRVSSLSSAVLGAGGGERKHVSARGRRVPSLRGGGGERATAAHGWCALAPTVSDGCLAPRRRTTAQFRGGDDECKGGNRKHQVGDHERLFVIFLKG